MLEWWRNILFDFGFFLRVFKVLFFLKSKFLYFSHVLFRPHDDPTTKSWAQSKILFLVQAFKNPGVPDLTPDQQANCCASCSYGIWHWIGLGGTIILTLAAAISVITRVIIQRQLIVSDRWWSAAVGLAAALEKWGVANLKVRICQMKTEFLKGSD